MNQRLNIFIIWILFFLNGLALGSWVPILNNIMTAYSYQEFIPVAFLFYALASLISPIVLGAWSDQHMPANRLIIWTKLLGLLPLSGFFLCLYYQSTAWLFFVCFGLYTFLTAPSWGLLSVVAMGQLREGSVRFPLIRLGATLGWIMAGVIVSYGMNADASVKVGFITVFAELIAIMVAFTLPQTVLESASRSWKSWCGLDGFVLLKDRKLAVFFAVTTLYSIPIYALYMYSAEMLKSLGDSHPAITMTMAQWSEVMAMLCIGFFMKRYPAKYLLLFALGLASARHFMSAYAGVTGVVGWHQAGIFFHGACYTFYFVTAQVFLDRSVPKGMRGRAQGLLTMSSAGIGPVIGSLFCGRLHHILVTEQRNWMHFWGILGIIIGACFILFAYFFKPEHKTLYKLDAYSVEKY